MQGMQCFVRDKWSGSKRRVLAVRASELSYGSCVVGRISSLDILGENYIHYSGGGILMAVVVVIDFSLFVTSWNT